MALGVCWLVSELNKADYVLGYGVTMLALLVSSHPSFGPHMSWCHRASGLQQVLMDAHPTSRPLNRIKRAAAWPGSQLWSWWLAFALLSDSRRPPTKASMTV